MKKKKNKYILYSCLKCGNQSLWVMSDIDDTGQYYAGCEKCKIVYPIFKRNIPDPSSITFSEAYTNEGLTIFD